MKITSVFLSVGLVAACGDQVDTRNDVDAAMKDAVADSGGSPLPPELELNEAGEDAGVEQAIQGLSVNRSDCQRGTLHVRVRGAQGVEGVLEAWLATGHGECQRASRSARVPSQANCTKLVLDHAQPTRKDDRDAYEVEVQLGPTCDTEGQRSIVFIQIPAPDSHADASSHAVLELQVDTTPPATPTDVSAGTGELTVPVTWSLVDPQDTAATLLITDSREDLACPSSRLQEGATFDVSEDSAGSGLLLKRLPRNSATVFFFDRADFHGAATLSVAVATQDAAGNVSPLSKVVCLERPI